MIKRYLFAALYLGLLSAAWATPIFPLSALAPGQQGYALTAGPGNVIERFTIEVIALQHDVELGFPLVLVRASGPFIEASGGVAAGMSGSPVYLPHQGDKVLLGAIGYIFPHSDTRIALVTPAEVMLGRAPQVVGFGGELFLALREAYGPPVAVATPLLLSGVSARASRHLAPLFTDQRVVPFPVQTGRVSAAQDEAFTLQPGSAVSVQLVRGDVTIAAVGTVTLIDGEMLYAFGHPLLGRGEVSFALAPAYVTYIVSSPVVPFKLADSGQRILGAITQDRPQAISGRVGARPNFIPITLSLTGPGATSKRFEVTSDERFYAPLLASATLQTLDQALWQLSAGTAELTWEIGLANGDTLRVLEQITHPSDIAAATAGLAAEPLAIFAENIFADPAVTGLSLSIALSQQQRYAEIIEVVAEDEEVQPGGFARVHLRLQPFRAEPLVRTLTIPLPRELAPGPLELSFRGGLMPEEEGEGDPILSFSELLISLREQVQARELVVDTFVDGERQQLLRQSFELLIQGSQTLTLTVVNGEVPEEPAPAEPDEDEDEKPDPLPAPAPGLR